MDLIGTKLRRLTLVAMLLCVSALIAACGGQGGGGDDGGVTVGYVPKALDQEFWITSEAGAEAADEELPGASVLVDAGSSEAAIDEQIAVVEDMLTRGVDALCVAPTAPDQLIPVLTRASGEVPVLLVDTDIPQWDGKTSYIGTDNLEGGRVGGEYIVEELGGSGTMAVIEGAPGNNATDARSEGAVEVVEEAGIEVVASVTANSDRAEGVNVMSDILQNNPDVEAVFSANDQMALGALETLRSRDLKGDVTVVGYDGTEEATQIIIDGGGMDATVAQNPYDMGSTCVEQAAAAANGEEIEANIDTGVTLVTEENAEDYLREYRERLEGGGGEETTN